MEGPILSLLQTYLLWIALAVFIVALVWVSLCCCAQEFCRCMVRGALDGGRDAACGCWRRWRRARGRPEDPGDDIDEDCCPCIAVGCARCRERCLTEEDDDGTSLLYRSVCCLCNWARRKPREEYEVGGRF